MLTLVGVELQCPRNGIRLLQVTLAAFADGTTSTAVRDRLRPSSNNISASKRERREFRFR